MAERYVVLRFYKICFEIWRNSLLFSLGVAWKDLNRQLELRGYILEDTQRFYKLAHEHEKVVFMDL